MKATEEFFKILYKKIDAVNSIINQPKCNNENNSEHQKEINTLKAQVESLKFENETLKVQLQIYQGDADEEELETSFTATPRQTILLFRELGHDFTDGTFNKTKVTKMLSILTSKAEGNINKKLTRIDDNNKYVQHDLKIVKKLLEDIKH